MNRRNYAAEMTALLRTIPQDTRLLLHSCCAPCSSRCLELLHSQVRVTVLYYNPNIDDRSEYEKRKAEQKRFLSETGWADFLDCDYETERFAALAKGRENCPEGGARCYECFRLRLSRTAEMARLHGFSWFATTLTVSPLKNAEWLNQIGFALAEEYGLNWLPTDFKKGNGYLRSVELSKEYGLYRQDYCGCSFSKAERERQRCRPKDAQ